MRALPSEKPSSASTPPMAPSREPAASRTQENEPLLPAVSYTESDESEPDDALAETRPSLWATLTLYKVCVSVCWVVVQVLDGLALPTFQVHAVGDLCAALCCVLADATGSEAGSSCSGCCGRAVAALRRSHS